MSPMPEAPHRGARAAIRYTPPGSPNDGHWQVSWLPDRSAAPPSRPHSEERVQWHVGAVLPGHSCGGSGGIGALLLTPFPLRPGYPDNP